MSLHARGDARMQGGVDRGARDATYLQQISAFGPQPGQLLDLLAAERLIVDDNAISARRGYQAVKRHHHDAGGAGLLDGAIESGWRSRIYHNGIITLENEILDLGGLGR